MNNDPYTNNVRWNKNNMKALLTVTLHVQNHCDMCAMRVPFIFHQVNFDTHYSLNSLCFVSRIRKYFIVTRACIIVTSTCVHPNKHTSITM